MDDCNCSNIIASRKSVRAFTKRPVKLDIIKSILECAARAPSGTNIQPWRVYVSKQDKIDLISNAILGSDDDPRSKEWDDYRYYPKEWIEPYLSRRMNNGIELYRAMNISHDETQKYENFINRNYSFFGAPIGLFLTIDRRLEKGSWIDLGAFIQNILLLAKANGLDSCPQASFAPHHRVIRPIMNIPHQEILVCGIAIGYADQTHPTFRLTTDRAPLSEWVFGL